jgi:hypothetical protein
VTSIRGLIRRLTLIGRAGQSTSLPGGSHVVLGSKVSYCRVFDW